MHNEQFMGAQQPATHFPALSNDIVLLLSGT